MLRTIYCPQEVGGVGGERERKIEREREGQVSERIFFFRRRDPATLKMPVIITEAQFPCEQDILSSAHKCASEVPLFPTEYLLNLAHKGKVMDQ